MRLVARKAVLCECGAYIQLGDTVITCGIFYCWKCGNEKDIDKCEVPMTKVTGFLLHSRRLPFFPSPKAQSVLPTVKVKRVIYDCDT